jgi:hypothetical protein
MEAMSSNQNQKPGGRRRTAFSTLPCILDIGRTEHRLEAIRVFTGVMPIQL